MANPLKSAFEKYLYQVNKEGSGKAASYLRALELLEAMLRAVPLGFSDCRDIWSVYSVERLIELRTCVLEEQKHGKSSPWVIEGIPMSYLAKGHCSAALTQLIDFLPQYQHASKALDLPSASLEAYFIRKEGKRIELPLCYRPLAAYLEAHRCGGEF